MTGRDASPPDGTPSGQIFGCGECGDDNVVKTGCGGREKSLPFSHRMIQILALPLEELKQKQYDINDRLSIYREGEEFAHCKREGPQT